MKIITGKVFMGRIFSQHDQQLHSHELHLPKIAHTDAGGGSSHTIDSDFKLKGKNIRSQSVASDEYVNGEHLQYSLKHKSERLGHKLMKRKWEKGSGSNKSKSPNGDEIDESNF